MGLTYSDQVAKAESNASAPPLVKSWSQSPATGWGAVARKRHSASRPTEMKLALTIVKIEEEEMVTAGIEKKSKGS